MTPRIYFPCYVIPGTWCTLDASRRGKEGQKRPSAIKMQGREGRRGEEEREEPTPLLCESGSELRPSIGGREERRGEGDERDENTYICIYISVRLRTSTER